jgi:uncharacterized protein YggE
MKVKTVSLVGVAGLALALILALGAWTQEETASQEPRLITVTGSAEVRVVPDEVILTLGVETWDKDLEVAKGQNDEIIKRVLARAGEHGVASEHIRTDYLSIEPRYRNGYYEARDFIGYFVRNTIVITLRDLTKFEGLLSSALDAGVNYVHGIEFRTTELREHRDEARALAVKAAQEKAVAMSEALGQSVGDPQAIDEVQDEWLSGYSSWWASPWSFAASQNVIQELGTAAFMSEGSLAPGQISVRARVRVAFDLH